MLFRIRGGCMYISTQAPYIILNILNLITNTYPRITPILRYLLPSDNNNSGWLLFRIWGACITVLQSIFAWCTLCYGLNYSNLSYRTVVRTGPYYFFRCVSLFSYLLPCLSMYPLIAIVLYKRWSVLGLTTSSGAI